MNCTTGEITRDPVLMEFWREKGDRILMLPDDQDFAEMKAEQSAPSLLAELGFQVQEIDAQVRQKAQADTLDFVRRVHARC